MDECCICYQKFQDSRSDKIVIIKHTNDDTLAISRKRGHYFHNQCIQQWRAQHGTCPLDRNIIAKLYTVPEYRVIGLELGLYNYDYHSVLRSVKINDDLLDQFTSIDEIDKNNRTLAFYACKLGNYSLVNKLLRRGADFNRPCGRAGFTPLMVAVCHYHSKVVIRLVSNQTVQSGLETIDSGGNTAFSYCCQYRQIELIREFLNRKLVSPHQVRYQLELYRDSFKEHGKSGLEIINMMCQYLKTDH